MAIVLDTGPVEAKHLSDISCEIRAGQVAICRVMSDFVVKIGLDSRCPALVHHEDHRSAKHWVRSWEMWRGTWTSGGLVE